MEAAWVQSQLIPICSGTTAFGNSGQTLPPQRQSEPSGRIIKMAGPGKTRSGALLWVIDTTTTGGKPGFDPAKKISTPATTTPSAVPNMSALFLVEIGLDVGSAG